MTYYKDPSRLKDDDREDLNEMLSVGESFRDIFTRKDETPSGRSDAFFAADRHYFDESDYQDHRHKSYPHMHQPLKPLNSRDLRKTSSRMPKTDASTEDEKIQEKLKKKKMRQQQKTEQFSPSLSKVTEGRLSDKSTSTDSNKSSDSDVERVTHRTKKRKRKVPATTPIIAPKDIEISVKPGTLSFLEEIHSDLNPRSYHDLTGLEKSVQQALPLPTASTTEPVQSMTSVRRENEVRDRSEISDRPRKISFFIDGETQPEAEVTDGQVHSSLAPSVKLFKHHHHHHHRDKRCDDQDLKHRLRHGDQLRRSSTTTDLQTTEPDEACNLCQSDLECMHDHRRGEMYNNYRRHKVYDRYTFQTEDTKSGRPIPKASTSVMLSSVAEVPSKIADLSKSSADHHPIYIQLDELRVYPKTVDQLIWQERIRWIRFEETYNEEACRFDPAHSSPLKFHTLLQFRRLFQKGCIILDIEAESFEGLCQFVVTHMLAHNHCSQEESLIFLNLLSVPHLRAGEKLPEVQASFSRSQSTGRKVSVHQSFGINDGKKVSEISVEEAMSNAAMRKNSSFVIEGEETQSSVRHRHGGRAKQHSSTTVTQFHSDLAGHLRPNTEAMSVWVGEVIDMKNPLVVFIRLANTLYKPTLNEIDDLPIKFVFIAIGPAHDDVEYVELGRVLATCMTDDKFRDDIYKAKDKSDIMDSLSLFLDNSIVLPVLGEVTANSLGGMLSQIEAYKRKMDSNALKQIPEENNEIPLDTLIQGPSAVVLKSGDIFLPGVTAESIVQVIERKDDPNCEPTLIVKMDEKNKVSASKKCSTIFCPPFSSLIRDIRGYKTRFVADFKDAFIPENLSIVLLAMLFVFFTNLAPAITFGALLNALVSKDITITLSLIATGSFQLIFALLGGQPIIIIGITGPIFIIENAINLIAIQNSINVVALRFWVAVYCAAFGVLIQFFNLDVLVKHVRRSIEEIFNAFIGIFFIIKAIITMCNAIPVRPVPCCNITGYPEQGQKYLTFFEKNAISGATFFLAFIMLIICLQLAGLKQSRMFRRRARTMIGSFNVPIGILIVTVLERLMFPNFNLPKLNIPSGEVNVSRFINIPDYDQLLKGDIGGLHGAGVGIGFLLCLVIITETSLAGISVAKPEKKMKKPCLFSLDLLFVLIIFPIVSGFIGWPFVSGAIVRSVTHSNALAKFDPRTPPGVPNKQIGCAEQRFTGIIVGLLVALSIFLGVILSLIPMAAMYGMFLFMGVTSLRDLFVVRRLILLMKRKKYWPDEDLCRNLPAARIATFITLQILIVGLLTALDCITEFLKTSYPSLVFPAIIILSAICREFLLTRWKWLDLYLSRLDKIHPVVLPVANVRRIKLDDGKILEYKPSTQEIINIKEKSSGSKASSKKNSNAVELNSYVNQNNEDKLV